MDVSPAKRSYFTCANVWWKLLFHSTRESTDLANAKSAYNELMMNVAEKEEDPEPISFKLKQKHPGWQSPLPITVGSASFDGTNTDN